MTIADIWMVYDGLAFPWEMASPPCWVAFRDAAAKAWATAVDVAWESTAAVACALLLVALAKADAMAFAMATA